MRQNRTVDVYFSITARPTRSGQRVEKEEEATSSEGVLCVLGHGVRLVEDDELEGGPAGLRLRPAEVEALGGGEGEDLLPHNPDAPVVRRVQLTPAMSYLEAKEGGGEVGQTSRTRVRSWAGVKRRRAAARMVVVFPVPGGP